MRRSCARSGPIANGTSVTTMQKEQHAHQRAAADADGEAHVAQDEGGDEGHVALPSRSSFAAIPSGPCVAATIIPPPARCWRIRSASISWPAASSAEVGSSSSQIGRGTAISRASESRRRCPADR